MAIGRVNTGGGGAGGKNYAAIAVIYPAGSTCTCTNGIKTFSTKGTDGSWIFSIPSNGTWTVSCTDGVNTASQAVVITEQYQAASVVLAYSLELIKDGKVKQTFTNVNSVVTESTDGYVKIEANHADWTAYGQAFGTYSYQVNLNEVAYSKLTIDGLAGAILRTYPTITVAHSGGTVTYTLTTTRNPAYEISLASMTGTITISVNPYAEKDSVGVIRDGYANIYNMILAR